jgi:multicomponent Na+:H+ antiporter subunit C
MTLFLSVVVGILFAVSVYLMLGRELKEVLMGFFLLTHAANLAIIEAGRTRGAVFPPLLGENRATQDLADPLPQALILTAIVIGFAVQGLLLTLLVVTWRRNGTLDVVELASDPAGDADGNTDATPEDAAPLAAPVEPR